MKPGPQDGWEGGRSLPESPGLERARGEQRAEGWEGGGTENSPDVGRGLASQGLAGCCHHNTEDLLQDTGYSHCRKCDKKKPLKASGGRSQRPAETPPDSPAGTPQPGATGATLQNTRDREAAAKAHPARGAWGGQAWRHQCTGFQGTRRTETNTWNSKQGVTST